MYIAIASLYFIGEFGKVLRGEMRRSIASKCEDIAIKTIKSELRLFFFKVNSIFPHRFEFERSIRIVFCREFVNEGFQSPQHS